MILIPISILLLASFAIEETESTPSVFKGSDCGAYCLAIAAKSLGKSCTINDVKRALSKPPASDGYSIDEVSQAAQKLGLHTLCLQTTVEGISGRRDSFCAICLLKEKHFVIAAGFQDGDVILVDLPKRRRIPVAEFERLWSGKAILVSTEPLAVRRVWFEWRHIWISLVLIAILLGGVLRLKMGVRNA
jgi:ABC-type bacteriocin/lantibiotic exporter with double-glycine peptidase domain